MPKVDRQLQVLRVVLPVQHRDAGHTIEHLGQVDLGAAGLDFLARDRADRRRCVKRGLARAFGADNDGLELRRRHGCLGTGGVCCNDGGEQSAEGQAVVHVSRGSAMHAPSLCWALDSGRTICNVSHWG
jgi:hypothetical protein